MNIGLIGYGFMGGAHLAAIEALPGATLLAVASRTRPAVDGPVRGNLNLKAGPLPRAVRWQPDWHTIVDDAAIDAVDICLPTHLHQEVILSALRRGKHVLCEKPMALTGRDCDELLQAALTSGRIFMVAQVLRFMQPYRHAAQFIQAAGPQAIESCTLRRSTGYPQWSDWLAREECSGGAILDLLSHDLDQALAWFGPPRTVSAVPFGEIDTARATLRYTERLSITVEGGWLTRDSPFAASFQIKTSHISLTFAGDKLLDTRGAQVKEIPLSSHDPYAEEIAYFLDCCRRDVAPDLCPPAASADAVRLALLVQQSRAQNGKELAWT